MKLRHDFAGHYNRPDIFHLHVNRAAPQLYSVHGVDQPQALPVAAATRALPSQNRRLEPPDIDDMPPPPGE
jgi:nitrilase